MAIFGDTGVIQYIKMIPEIDMKGIDQMAVKTPTVPTEIVVHIGSPEEAGKTIIVPFPEYIKNVASNEIYPSWPEDAIKANVLAQISFALNRIYNEWYPSQGYNFDITLFPAYDQTFKEDSQSLKRFLQL